MRKMNLRKNLTITLALVCTLMLLGSSGNTISALASTATELPAELSIFYSSTSSLADRSDTDFIRYIEEQTNTKISIIDAPSGEANNKLNVLIASSSEPDICQVYALNIINNYGQQGAFHELGDIIASQMPNTIATLNDDALTKMKASDGKIYNIPYIQNTGAPSFFIREDWLQNLGLERPTTLDEYYNVLKLFTQNDPDGNGEADTYGLGYQMNRLELLCGPFGIPSAQWIDADDGSLIYSDVSPQMKEALAFGAKLYAEKIIDPEFAIMKSEQFEQRLTSGGYGVMMAASSTVMRYNLAIQNLVPEGELKFLLPPKANGVSKGYSATLPIVDGTDGKTFGGFVGISTNTKELDSAVNLLDWFFSDAGKRASIWGVEGIHYEMVDNWPQLIPALKGAENSANYVAEIGSYWLAGDIAVKAGGDNSLWLQVNNPLAVGNMILSLDSAFNKIVHFNTPTGDSATGDINKAKSEIFTQIIMNGISVEDGWTQWINEFNRLGGETWTQEVNESYKLINAK
jgi:ABC-type sugar transport system, periplasmic component